MTKASPKPKYPVQDVFLLDLKRPWRPIRMGRAEIRVSKKMSWALLTEASGWPPHLRRSTLLGKGAFFTFRDAATAKIGRLQKAIKNEHALAYFGPGPEVVVKIKAQLAAYEQNGVVH
mgnify:CR=1 FL=1